MEPTPAHIKKGLLPNMSTNIKEIKIVCTNQPMQNIHKNIGKNLITLKNTGTYKNDLNIRPHNLQKPVALHTF